MSILDRLDAAYDAAHEAWGNHVDVCPDCRRSPFACPEGMRLCSEWNVAWNVAWTAARAVWKTMSQAEKDAWIEAKED